MNADDLRAICKFRDDEIHDLESNIHDLNEQIEELNQKLNAESDNQ